MPLLTPTHLAPYRALMLEAYAQAPDAFTSTPEERAGAPDAWWARRLAGPDGGSDGGSVVFGSFVGGDLVGAVALEFGSQAKTRHKAQVVGMYVRPAARGRGVARALLAEALAHAAARPGLQVLTLTVTQGNTAAQALYAACGFEVFGVEPMAVAGAAGFLAKVHMWHRLQRPGPAGCHTGGLHATPPTEPPMPTIADRLHALGLVLPAPLQQPSGGALPFPWVQVVGQRVLISGHGPTQADGSLARPLGKVGGAVSPQQAYQAARLTGLAILGSLQRELGSLDRIACWVRVFGMVNSAPGFNQQPAVINGFSDLILEVFGPERGRHARSAVGLAELPFDIPVEIEGEALLA